MRLFTFSQLSPAFEFGMLKFPFLNIFAWGSQIRLDVYTNHLATHFDPERVSIDDRHALAQLYI